VTKVCLWLAVALIGCSLSLVTSQQRARRLFIDLERAQARAQQLEVQWDQLQLEQTGLSKVSLIDSRARKTMAMQPVAAERTLHLSIDVVAEARAREASR